MLATDYDVAVIGCGPAGSALALLLARRGFRVAAVDARSIPHDTLCGEFLSADALARLDELGVLTDIHNQAQPAAIRAVRITAPGVLEVTHRLAESARGLSRLLLDGALAQAAAAAGAELRPRWRATRWVPPGDQASPAFTVEGITASGARDRLTARVAVGAFGKAEWLGAGAGGGHGASDKGCEPAFIAWKAHHAGLGPGPSVELHAFCGGYVGVGPIEGGLANVCGIATQEAFKQAGRSLPALVARARRDNAALAFRLAGLERCQADLAAARMSFRHRRPLAGEFLLIGDAAGMIAPLAGDGIGIALSSAAVAAPWIAEHLAGRIRRAAMLAGYRASWRRAFTRQLVLGAALHRLLINPRGAAFLLRLGHALPPLVGWLIRSTRDTALARAHAIPAGAATSSIAGAAPCGR